MIELNLEGSGPPTGFLYRYRDTLTKIDGNIIVDDVFKVCLHRHDKYSFPHLDKFLNECRHDLTIINGNIIVDDVFKIYLDKYNYKRW